MNQFSTNYQDLIMNRNNPLHNFTYNQTVAAFGTVTGSAQNQITPNSSMTILNPQLEGPMNLPSVVPTRFNVSTKYDNKRRNTEDKIALFNWRDNTSLNNSTRVQANYYQEQLTQKAKEKVRTKQMNSGYSTQYSQNVYRTDEFKDNSVNSTKESFMTPQGDKLNNFTTNELQKKDNNFVLDYTNILQETNKTVPSYNPLLAKSKGNLPAKDLNNPSYPDERMTHYIGERPYTTKGDRQLQAREMATSEYIKERRQLQAESEQAMYGTPKAPRQTNPNIGMGIKSQYHIEDENKSTRIKTNEYPINNIKNLYKKKGSSVDEPNYSDAIINTTIKQEKDIDKNENIKKDYREHWQTSPNYNLNLYQGRTSDLTKQHSKLQQQSELQQVTTYSDMIENSKNKIFKEDIRDKVYNEVDKKETFIGRIIHNLKSLFWVDEDEYMREILDEYKDEYDDEYSRLLRKEVTEDKYNKRYYDSSEEYSEDLLHDPQIDKDQSITEYNKKQNRHTYWVVDDVTKFEFNDENNLHSELVKEPQSMLTDGKEIIRNVIVRDVDSLKVHQRIEDLESGETKYKLVELPYNYLDNILKNHIFVEDRRKVNEDPLKSRLSKELVELDYDDHIKLASLTEQAPDDFKIESKTPITYHHRVTLSDKDKIEGVITNIQDIDKYLKKELNLSNLDEYLEKKQISDVFKDKSYANKRDNFETYKHKLYDISELTPSNNPDNNNKMGIKSGLIKDPRNITKRFNNYM